MGTKTQYFSFVQPGSRVFLADQGDESEVTNPVALTEAQQSRVTEAFELWDDVSGFAALTATDDDELADDSSSIFGITVPFTDMSITLGNALPNDWSRIVFGNITSEKYAGVNKHTDSPIYDNLERYHEIYFDNVFMADSFAPGSQAFVNALHEIGHSVLGGLHTDWGVSQTVMNTSLQTSSTGQYASTPMPGDIDRAIAMFGPSTTTRTGDDTYGFHAHFSGTYRAALDFDNYRGTPLVTIYDNGGNDTLDASRFTDRAHIDLNPGATSWLIGDTNETFAIIYKTTWIENAVGTGQDDKIYGNALSNRLWGGRGNDTIDGGLGADEMHGGEGDDSYVVDNPEDRVTDDPGEANGLHDKVYTDLESYDLGRDAVWVEDLEFTRDVNAVGHGNALNNIIIGAGGSDWLYGEGGNDKLDGGMGADTLVGGTGDDTYVVGAGDTVVEDVAGPLGGTDTVETALSNYSLSANVENLTFTSPRPHQGYGNDLHNWIQGSISGDKLYGFDGNDTLIGGGGSDTLDGGIGNDLLVGGTGADTFVGGADYDMVDYTNATSGVIVDLAYGSPLDVAYIGIGGANQLMSPGEAAGDTFQSIEAVRGSAYGDVIRGDDNDNVIDGRGGNNTLDGRGGNDVFHVDTYDTDTVYGGTGNNTLAFTLADDAIAIDLRSQSADFWNWNVGTYGAGGSITYYNIQNLIGGRYGDVLTGDGNANILDGFAGSDILTGMGGGDTFMVDASGSDTVTAEGVNNTLSFGHADRGVTVDLSSRSTVFHTSDATGFLFAPLGAGDGLVTFSENIQNLTGSGFSDTLIGDGNANVLDGGGGSDTLQGMGGGDTFMVDAAGDDVVIGAGENNTMSFIHAGRGVDVDLSLTSAIFQGPAGDFFGRPVSLILGTVDYSGIQNLTGSAFGDTLTGDGNANVLDGAGGNNTLNGAGGNDEFQVDRYGWDTIDGGADNNTVSFTRADAGVNVDLTWAATGFVTSFLGPDGNATGGVLLRNVQNLTGSAFVDTLSGDGVANVLVGGAGNDTLHGGGQNDTLYGGFHSRAEAAGFDGDDIIYGDGGDDTIHVLWGNETVHGGEDNDTLSFDEVTAGLTLTLDGGTGHTTYGESATFTDPSGFGSSGFNGLFTVTWDGIENLTGGTGADVFTGDIYNNKLDGGLGSDTAVFHGAQSEYAITRLADGSIQVVNSVAGRDGTDMLVNMETARFADGTSVDLTAGNWASAPIVGTEGADNLVGTVAAEVIDGRGGNDWLTGGSGDTLLGGGGDDYFFVDGTPARVDGGAGWDALFANSIATADTFRLALAGTNLEYVAGHDGVDEIDARGTNYALSVSTYDGNDTVSAGDGGNAVWAGGGNDTIHGGAGLDQLFGGEDNDVITGGAFNVLGDRLFGEGGNDTLTSSGNSWVFGGAGIDTIVGGAGDWLNGDDGNDIITGGAGTQQIVGGADNDVLTGGADFDRFDFADAWGNDRITDFEVGLDRISLADVTGLDSFAQLTIRAVAEGTEVSFAGNSILLAGLTASALTPEHFLL